MESCRCLAVIASYGLVRVSVGERTAKGMGSGSYEREKRVGVDHTTGAGTQLQNGSARLACLLGPRAQGTSILGAPLLVQWCCAFQASWPAEAAERPGGAHVAHGLSF